MKSRFLVIAIIATGLLSSCKGEKENNKVDKENVAVESKNEYFSVEMNVKTPVEDNFAVYFTEDATSNFNSERVVWSGVLGQEESQKIIFKFPSDVVPTHVRFDLGLNKEQGDIILEGFKLDYYGNTFEAKGSDFLKYFIQNELVKTEIDEVNGTIKFLKNPNGFEAPFYYPHQALLDEITKITN